MDYCFGLVFAIRLSSSPLGLTARRVGVRALGHITEGTRGEAPDGNNHLRRSLIEARQSTPFWVSRQPEGS